MNIILFEKFTLLLLLGIFFVAFPVLYMAMGMFFPDRRAKKANLNQK